MYTVSYLQAFSPQNSIWRFTSTRLEYETIERCYTIASTQKRDRTAQGRPCIPYPALTTAPLYTPHFQWRWYMVTRAVAIRLCVPRPRTGIDEEASQLSRVKPQKNEEPNLR